MHSQDGMNDSDIEDRMQEKATQSRPKIEEKSGSNDPDAREMHSDRGPKAKGGY